MPINVYPCIISRHIISHHVPQVKLTAKHLDSVVIEDSTFQVFFFLEESAEGNYETIMKRILMTKMMTRRPGSSLAWYFLLQHHISIGHKVLLWY